MSDLLFTEVGDDRISFRGVLFYACVPVKMNAPVLLLWGLLLAGCGGDSSSNDSNSSPPSTQSSGGANNPSSLDGRTYSFTVTARQGLSEPVGSTYSIAFSGGNYTFYPSPQNIERTNSFTAAYTYDANSATAVLSGVEAVTATFNFTSPTSGTYHFMEEDGEMQDGTFLQF